MRMQATKRGDIIARTDSTGSLSCLAQYEAYGNTSATVRSLSRQGKGLLNEGFRYRDLKAGYQKNLERM